MYTQREGGEREEKGREGVGKRESRGREGERISGKAQ